MKQIFGDKPTTRKDVKVRLVSLDFGRGFRRIDLEPTGISIILDIDDKTGQYEGFGFATSFHQLGLCSKLYAFLKEA
jgi:hypothetical protein